MSGTVRALLHRQLDGPWQVFVVDGASSTDWPEHTWPAGHPIPAPADRLTALAELGYRPGPGAEWQWSECDPAAVPTRLVRTVSLIAAVDVHPAGGERP